MIDARGLMMRFACTLLAGAMLSGCVSAGQAKSPHSCYHRDEAVETQVGYCQAVRVGNVLYISGNAGRGSMDVAVRTVYGSLQKTLQAHGLSFGNVVKETVFTTDLDAFIQSKEIRKEIYGELLPAATWVQVQRLYTPSHVVEIELVAEFPR